MKYFVICALLAIFLSGCSTSAYIVGYNLVATEDREIGFQTGQEQSDTALALFSLETANIGDSEITPLMIVTIPAGVALSPLFFIVGNISGAVETIPGLWVPIEERPAAERRKLANISSSAEVLSTLAKDPERPVRYAVARNPNAPPEILKKLAEDKTWQVRSGVAENTQTPADVLEQLVEDEDENTRHAALHNPNTPEQAKQKASSKKPTQNQGWWETLPYLDSLDKLWQDDE